jgi:geranylgeranyl diphosphate synthase type II
MQVCEGQQYDMDFQADTQVSMEDYMKMIGLKTAVLIACSAKMGAIIGRADEQACANFYDYGYALGLAFQVADDYLDVFGDEKVFGKPIGGDILNNKKSWLITRALQKADQVEGISDKLHKATKIALLKAMAQPVETAEQRAEKIAKVKELYVEMRVDEDAKYEIVRLNDKALEFARKLNLGKVGTEILVRFAEKLIGRAK